MTRVGRRKGLKHKERVESIRRMSEHLSSEKEETVGGRKLG